MTRVTIYSTKICPYCTQAKALFDKWGVAYDEVLVDQDELSRQEFARVTNNARTVPQILIDDKLIGGYTDLAQLHSAGELDEFIASASANSA